MACDCEKSFKWKKQLYVLLWNYFDKKIWIAGSSIPNHMKLVHMSELPDTPCPHCGKIVKELQRHIKRSHEKLTCDLCGKLVPPGKNLWIRGLLQRLCLLRKHTEGPCITQILGLGKTHVTQNSVG